MSSPSGKSPGKGGKSLDQLRKAQTTSGEGSSNQPTVDSQPNSTSDNDSSQLHPSPLASSRPKGKDFASLSARQPPLPPQAQQELPAITTPAPTIVPHMQQGPTGGKPKGKDFSQMASRMGPPPVLQQPPQLQSLQAQQQPQQQLHYQPPPMPPQQQHYERSASDSSQYAARAAHMQAAARAAAGMPPLDRPSQVPQQEMAQPIQAPQQNYTQPQQQQRMHVQQQAPSQARPSPPMPQQQQQHQRKSSVGSISATAPAPDPLAVPVKKTRDNSNPTAAPTVQENRVAAMGAHKAPLVGPRIQQLVAEIDPNYSLDAQAEEQLLRMADDFLDKVCASSLTLAQHRGSKVLDVQDVQMVLQKQWKISIPGLPPLPSAVQVAASGIAGATAPTSGNSASHSTAGGARRKTTASGSSSKTNKTTAGDVKSQI
ncbi:hypothetical protein MPSEU_000372200 [Mayamaea pseudoterrestris]|nr:hypothetical protein MPSEU_000372200 [Mayamaea pseudoterrestris]